MKKEIDPSTLLTFEQYAAANNSKAQPLSRQRVMQLVKDGRLKVTEIAGKKFICKSEKVKPSKKVLGRPPLKKKK